MLLGSSLIALGPFFVEFSEVSAEANTFYRLLVGALFFIGFTLKKNEFKMDPSFLLICMIGGILLVSDLFLWNQSVLFIGAGLATILSNLDIVFLIFIGKLFFSEQLPNKFPILCIAMVIGTVGLIYPIFPALTSRNFIGIFLALGASLSYALYLFCIKYLSKEFSGQTSTAFLAVICLTGCIVLGAIILARDTALFKIHSWHSFISIFLNSILSQVIAWWLISTGMRHLSLSLSGFLLLLQPTLTFLFDCLFLSRNTHWLQLIGSLCILGSIYISTQNQKSQKESYESNHTDRG